AVPKVVAIPRSLLTDPDAAATIKVIEWSNDNRRVLLERKFGDKHEFIVFDREEPDKNSYNLNRTFAINPTTVSLRNKRNDQFYTYEAEGGIVRIANTKDKTISAPLLTGVIAFESYNDDIILYVTPDPASSDKVLFRILQGEKSYTLRNSPQGNRYVLAISEH